MWIRQTISLMFSFALFVCAASAQDFQVTKVKSIAAIAIDQLKPKTIIFNDHQDNDITDRATSFFRFEDWGKAAPVQKLFLNLYPTLDEAVITKTVEGMTRTYKDKLQIYVVEARFMLSKPDGSISLNRYATLSFIENIDIDSQVHIRVDRPPCVLRVFVTVDRARRVESVIM
jgi:hypothetical protein